MDKMKGGFICLICAVGIFSVAIPLRAGQPPKYFTAVQQELTRLGLNADCRESTGVCKLTLRTESTEPAHQSVADAPQPIVIQVDDSTATIRIAVENFLPAHPRTTELFKNLLQLNNKLVVAKFSLDTTGQKILLSAIVNTDSNFDRKTFRSVVKGFLEIIQTLSAKLTDADTEKKDSVF